MVNFDVPNVPEDYIHRVGRTARAEMTGEAFTLVSPEEEEDFGKIERAVGARIERVRVDGFDYDQRPDAPLEVPRAERIRAIQEKRREDRARAAAKAERRTSNGNGAAGGEGSSSRSDRRRRRRRRG